MKWLLKWLTWAGIIALAAWKLDWTDRFYLVCGAALLFVPVLITLKQQRQRRRSQVDDKRSLKLHFVQPPLWAIATLAYLYVGFLVLEHTPAGSWMADHDRQALTVQLDATAERKDYLEAVDLITQRLQCEAKTAWKSISDDWRTELVRRQHGYLIDAAKLAESDDTKIKLLDLAIELAKREKNLGAEAQMLHDQVQQRMNSQKFLVKAQADGHWQKAVEDTRALLGHSTNAEERRALAVKLCDSLVGWARTAESASVQKERLLEAQMLAHEYKFKHETSETLLAEAERQLADAAELDQRLRKLEEQADWQELKALLHVVINQGATANWPRPYDQLYVDVLCCEADATSELQEQKAILNAALNFAEEHQLQVDGVQQRLRAIQAENAMGIQLISLEQALKRRPTQQSHLDYLRAIVQTVPETEWNQPYDRQLFDALLSSAEQAQPSEARDLLREAFPLGQEKKFDVTKITESLKLLDVQLQREETLNAKLEKLRASQDQAGIANCLREYLAANPNDPQSAELKRQLAQTLLTQAERSPELDEQQRLLREATQLVDQKSIDGRLAHARLELVQQELQRQLRLRTQLKELYQRQAYDKLAGVLELATREYPISAWPQPFDRMLIQNYLAWGASLQDLAARREKYAMALQIAKKYQIDPSEATQRLAEVDRQIAQQLQLNAPISLPEMSTAALVRVDWLAYPPVIVVYVAVQSGGKEVTGLTAKDFQVEVNGQAADLAAVAPIDQQNLPLILVLAVDTSASLRGQPWELSKAGILKLAENIRGQDLSMKVLSASEPGRTFTGWIGPSKLDRDFLSKMNPEGKTAFLDSIHQALIELRSKPGQRRLVIFSDGTNTVSARVTLRDLIALARQDEIVIDAIGLSSVQFDPVPLQQLTWETGGTYIEASSAAEIVDRFELASQRVRPSGYRLVVVPHATPAELPERFALTVKVGAKNAATAASMLDAPVMKSGRSLPLSVSAR